MTKVPSPARKRPVKPATDSQRIERATVSAARVLVEAGYSDSYDVIRGEVLRAFAMAFARAFGMRIGFLPRAFVGLGDAAKAFGDAVASLDCAELDAGHFGHVHEHLSAWTCTNGELVAKDRGSVHFTPRSLARSIVDKTLEPLLKSVPPERTLELRVCDPSVGGGVFLLELMSQLGQRMVDAGVEKDLLVAKRLVAVHCAYGADICRWAVATTKIAMWLECRAEGMPFDWLDDNIKCGDTLVGLMPEQFARFHWLPDKTKKGAPIPEVTELRALLEDAVNRGAAVRRDRMAALADAARGAA